MFRFEYTLQDAGWATARFGDGTEQIETSVSYLSNPLRDMCLTASMLLDNRRHRSPTYGEATLAFYFCAEPGGIFLVLDEPPELPTDGSARGRSSELTYHVLVADDYPSTVEGSEEKFSGATTIDEFARAVHTACKNVIDEVGFGGYDVRWMDSDFPLTEFARLSMLLGHETLTVSLSGYDSTHEL